MEGGLLVGGPVGGVQGVQAGGGLGQPFVDLFGGLGLAGAGLLACGLLGGLLLVLVPGGDHGPGLFLPGDGDQGLAGDGGVGAALVPDLLGKAVERKDAVLGDGGRKVLQGLGVQVFPGLIGICVEIGDVDGVKLAFFVCFHCYSPYVY